MHDLQVLGCKSAVAAWMEDNNMGALYELSQASRVLVDGVIEVGVSLIERGRGRTPSLLSIRHRQGPERA